MSRRVLEDWDLDWSEQKNTPGRFADDPAEEPAASARLPTEYPDEVAEIRHRDAEIDAEIAREEAGLPVPSGGSDLPARLEAEWRNSSAGYDFRMAEAGGAVEGLLDALNTEDQIEVEQSFHALNGNVQAAILGELGLGGGGATRTASQADIDRFAASELGSVLVPFWRGRAGKNLGMVNQRIGRIEAGMSESDKAAMWSWFDDLPERAAVAALCVLAG